MNTFWLKMAVFAVIVVGLVILVKHFAPSDLEVKTEKTFYDVAAEDRKRLLAEPKEAEDVQQQKPVQEQKKVAGQQKAAEPVPAAKEPVTLYFKELSEIEKLEAERLLDVAVPGRSIGRLPMTGFKLMVDNCRRIIQRWPDSWYAYRAQQMLADMPPRFRERYKVTEEELDLSRFTEPRPGTKPFTFKESH